LKAAAITSNLIVKHVAIVDFDRDLPKYGTKKGVYISEADSEVFAPVVMWLEAVDLVWNDLD
jgi:xylulokinase